MDEVTRTEIARLRWHLTALGFEHAMLRHYWALRSVKYDPDQPRVPAGNSDGGQWTGGHGGEATFSAARRVSPGLEAQCDLQYRKDIFQCRMVGLPSCCAQASLR
jgi:hypothetical protein